MRRLATTSGTSRLAWKISVAGLHTKKKLYVFAVAMRPGTTTADVYAAGVTTATATVPGESRSVTVSAGTFSDSFAPYDVHLYEISK